jgi:hypothetical protein
LVAFLVVAEEAGEEVAVERGDRVASVATVDTIFSYARDG